MIGASFTSLDGIEIGVIAVLLSISGFLALAETSLVRMSRVRARALLDEGRRGARQLVRLIEHPERFLNPVLLLVLVCQLISATLVGVIASHWLGPIGVVIGTLFEVVVIFVIFEAVPKNWAVHNADRAALLSAPLVGALIRFLPLRAASTLLNGVANVLTGRGWNPSSIATAQVTESELLAMADVAHAEDVIETSERAFIHSIIDFGDAVVREVMVPRPDMVNLDDDTTVTGALEQALVAGKSRLPVFEDSVDDVVGIAYVKDLVRAEHDGHGPDPVRTHIRPAHFVPESKRLTMLLREMQERQYHMSIVVDEYGGTAGLVTLEDLIEELVGEIVDEYDVEEPVVERREDGSIVVNGRMSIDDTDDLLEAHLPQGTWDTVGGLVLDLAGHVPEEGERVECEGFVLVAERVQGRRIGKVRIELSDAAIPHGEGSSSVRDRSRDGAQTAIPVPPVAEVHMRSGFVAVIGRPNVGKSSLVNRLVGTKVTITSSRPNTTRHEIRGILHLPDTQIVFVDTPGLHRPKTSLGERLNDTARSAMFDVNVIVVVVDGSAAIGPGDRGALADALRHQRVGPAQADAVISDLDLDVDEDIDSDEIVSILVAVNKVDRSRRDEVMVGLSKVADIVQEISAGYAVGTPDAVEYFPISAKTGQGVDDLCDAIARRLPEGPEYYPEDMQSDVAEETRVAELVREQLLARLRDELPHAVACRITEWEWPVIRCEIIVERDSQKAIVIGKGGEILKEVGIAVRKELPEGAYLELFVKVERRWQQRDGMLDRFGY